MKIYNTLTKRKEEFVPLEEGKVKMYACGITVSCEAHIGHAFQAIVYDIFRKFLEKQGYQVTYARNYTDVDDKIIARSKETGIPADKYAEMMIGKIDAVMQRAEVDEPTLWLKATENIGNIIDFIQGLIDGGHAYPAANGDVYFDVDTFPAYGQLSGRDKEDALDGVRVENDEEKKNPYDFALWKAAKEGEISWDSPWGKGRPGWHIECSAMNRAAFGDQIDIHGGGRDLIFPHHENEIAQSEAANGVPFSKYWMHNGFLNIDNRKMSKSLGNFFTVREIGEKYDLQVLRFFMLSAHYRSPLNFSAELMEAAKSGLERIHNAADNLLFLAQHAADDKMSDEECKMLEEAAEFTKKFEAAMEDDFNTADAIAAVFELVKYCNMHVGEGSSAKLARALYDQMKTLCDVLGIILEKEPEILDEEIERLIEERQQARKEKNFARADEIRDQLAGKGILLEDTREGVKWKRA